MSLFNLNSFCILSQLYTGTHSVIINCQFICLLFLHLVVVSPADSRKQSSFIDTQFRWVWINSLTLGVWCPFWCNECFLLCCSLSYRTSRSSESIKNCMIAPASVIWHPASKDSLEQAINFFVCYIRTICTPSVSYRLEVGQVLRLCLYPPLIARVTAEKQKIKPSGFTGEL